MLSNSGTPEGHQLEELSGMKKIDKQYWAIDRLSTFQKSDIKDNPQIREVFEKSGCNPLFNKISILDDDSGKHPEQAIRMLKFLEKNKDKEQMLAEI